MRRSRVLTDICPDVPSSLDGECSKATHAAFSTTHYHRHHVAALTHGILHSLPQAKTTVWYVSYPECIAIRFVDAKQQDLVDSGWAWTTSPSKNVLPVGKRCVVPLISNLSTLESGMIELQEFISRRLCFSAVVATCGH